MSKGFAKPDQPRSRQQRWKAFLKEQNRFRKESNDTAKEEHREVAPSIWQDLSEEELDDIIVVPKGGSEGFLPPGTLQRLWKHGLISSKPTTPVFGSGSSYAQKYLLD